jgi:NAD(P)-dependent dehydrogenase (short-subunit alcohol dehydrogenase family)
LVAIADRNILKATSLASELTAAGARASAIEVDMNDRDAIESMIQSVIAQYSRIDILVNNAAAVYLDSVDLNIVDADLEVWDEAIRVNLNAPMLASRAAIPHMLSRGGGSIVMVSSMSYRLASGNRPAYDVTKAGLNQLARSIAVGFGKRGVRCNVVAPGLTLSPSVQTQIPAEFFQIYLDHTMAPRLGEPKDQAAAIVFLASDDAAFVNGTVLEVDGGMAAYVPVVPSLLKLQGTH